MQIAHDALYLAAMAVHVYRLAGDDWGLTGLAGPTLDAVSLQLPAGSYTTMRTYDRDRIPGLSAHLQRLADSHTAVRGRRQIDLPAIRSALRGIIEREALPVARLRVTVPSGNEGVYIAVEPFTPYPAECYASGVRCQTTRLARVMPQAKMTEFIAPSRAEKAKRAPGIHELLLVDARDAILEGVSSNFFAVSGGVLRTADEGVLEGVTRGIVLDLAPGLAPVSCQPIRLADVPGLSEAFITSASREVMPVVEIDETTIGSGAPGPITQAFMRRYRDYLDRIAERP